MTPAEQMREAAAIARIADRIERQAKAVAAYSLFDTPRKIPNFPTTVEVSLSYFTDIANELRALPAEATEPADIARMKAALEMARDALTEIQTRSNEMMTGRVSYLNRIENLSVTAITTIREALGET